MRPKSYDWDFPLPRTHTGILQGNGTLGAMIWGEQNVLKITFGRADLWDHRGGMPWTDKMSFANIRGCLERNDEKRLRELFERTAHGEGEPSGPSIIPVGRIELEFKPDVLLQSGHLMLDDGSVVVKATSGGRSVSLDVHFDMRKPVLAVRLPKALRAVVVRPVPAWDTLRERMAGISFKEPERFSDPGMSGWMQAMPRDPGVCVGYRLHKGVLCIAVPRGETTAGGRRAAAKLIGDACRGGCGRIRSANLGWWKSYWSTVPEVSIPNNRLSFLYWYGMYKFASFTNPDGVPATLQGPWIEDYQMPPWSSDYHFNINVQMCYQPAYHGNRLENLRPLFDMIFSWMPTLRHNARVFLGIDDGVMLPHAVDDRCVCMGGFWTGSVDHGCTAWVACMMHRYYRYTMDKAFLRKAYPFMVAAMRVYEGMMERDGDRLVLPVTTSPEYRGSAMNAWGRNASFQLACTHALAEALVDSAAALGEPERPVWRQIMAKLPKACVQGEGADRMINLWEGTSLEESHRHHSHLAGITPFDVLPMDDPEWQAIVERSLAHWIFRGPGLWSGWCIPWASMIHSHVGNCEAAELYLDVFDRIYTNQGYGTLHDASVPGFTLMGIGAVSRKLHRPEIMQMDGGMGAVAAVQEMLLHTRRGVTHLFGGAPAGWKQVAFSGMRADGAFLIDAARERGLVVRVDVQSPAGGVFRLANPWGSGAAIIRGGRRETASGPVLNISTRRGERLLLRPA